MKSDFSPSFLITSQAITVGILVIPLMKPLLQRVREIVAMLGETSFVVDVLHPQSLTGLSLAQPIMVF